MLSLSLTSEVIDKTALAALLLGVALQNADAIVKAADKLSKVAAPCLLNFHDLARPVGKAIFLMTQSPRQILLKQYLSQQILALFQIGLALCFVLEGGGKLLQKISHTKEEEKAEEKAFSWNSLWTRGRIGCAYAVVTIPLFTQTISLPFASTRNPLSFFLSSLNFLTLQLFRKNISPFPKEAHNQLLASACGLVVLTTLTWKLWAK
jgi:hypothetical protein